MIYFMQNKDDLEIKIGYSKDVRTRYLSVKHSIGYAPLEIIGTMDGEKADEKELHSMFAHLRTYGEWFSPGVSLVDYIGNHATPFDQGDLGNRQGKYVAGPGRDPLFDEPMVRIPGTIPESYKKYLIKRAKEEGVSMAEYLRRLIQADTEAS